jgi:hypothetical protein
MLPKLYGCCVCPRYVFAPLLLGYATAGGFGAIVDVSPYSTNVNFKIMIDLQIGGANAITISRSSCAKFMGGAMSWYG